MGLLSTLAKGAGSLLGGDTIKDVGGIIDNLHTSGEEKAAAKERITSILAQAEQAAQAQVSARWEADMKHGSWLSKNIRPLTLVFLTAIFTILSIFDGNLTIGEKAFYNRCRLCTCLSNTFNDCICCLLCWKVNRKSKTGC